MVFAPVLQDVAARVGSVPPELRLREPARFAYALRDAIAIARPDWIVTHHDLDLEAAGAAGQIDAADDVLDVDLAGTPQGAAALELTATLAGLYPGSVVAASVTGPATMAGRLVARLGDGRADLDTVAEDCGDVVAALAAAHAERGAARVLVWEPEAGPMAPGILARAHEPVVRRLALLGIESVAVGSADLRGTGYGALAWTSGGQGAALVSRASFSDGESLAAAIGAAEATAGASGVLVSDGPVRGDCDLTLLRRLGERAPTIQTPGGTT